MYRTRVSDDESAGDSISKPLKQRHLHRNSIEAQVKSRQSRFSLDNTSGGGTLDSMQRSAHALSVGMVISLCIGTSWASPTQAGFESARHRVLQAPMPSPILVRWETVTHATMESAEIRTKIAALGSEPDPQSLAVLRREEWLRSSGPLVTTNSLWFISHERFRLNEDSPIASWNPQFDAVVNGSEGWTYAGNGVVTAMELSAAPRGQSPALQVSTIETFRLQFLTGGLGFGPENLTVSRFVSNGHQWTAWASVENQNIHYRFDGSWVAASDSYLVDRVMVQSPTFADTDGTVFEFRDHAWNELANTYVTGKTQRVQRDGTVIESQRLLAAESFPPQNFADYARVPTPSITDPLRPDRIIRRMDEFRTRIPTSTLYNSETGDFEQQAVQTRLLNRSHSSWRWIGWSLLCLTVAFFALLQFRKQ